MNNMPDVTKHFIGCRLPIEVLALAKREAEIRKMQFTDFLVYVLMKEIERSKTELTEEDIDWMNKTYQKNLETRRRAQNGK